MGSGAANCGFPSVGHEQPSIAARLNSTGSARLAVPSSAFPSGRRHNPKITQGVDRLQSRSFLASDPPSRILSGWAAGVGELKWPGWGFNHSAFKNFQICD